MKLKIVYFLNLLLIHAFCFSMEMADISNERVGYPEKIVPCDERLVMCVAPHVDITVAETLLMARHKRIPNECSLQIAQFIYALVINFEDVGKLYMHQLDQNNNITHVVDGFFKNPKIYYVSGTLKNVLKTSQDHLLLHWASNKINLYRQSQKSTFQGGTCSHISIGIPNHNVDYITTDLSGACFLWSTMDNKVMFLNPNGGPVERANDIYKNKMQIKPAPKKFFKECTSNGITLIRDIDKNIIGTVAYPFTSMQLVNVLFCSQYHGLVLQADSLLYVFDGEGRDEDNNSRCIIS